MGISNTQYRDIMFEYDQTRMRNQRLLDSRYKELYEKIPELKEIHDKIVELSVEQARQELLNPEDASRHAENYSAQKESLLQRKADILLENHYPKDYLCPIYTCKDCKDTGYIDGKPCHCFTQAKLQALYENSNISEILEKENFDTFCEEYYDDTVIHENLSITPRENIRRVKEICLDFVKHFDNIYDNILFYGPTGVGKTFITHCIAKELLDSGHTVVYLTSLQLFDILEKNKFYKEDTYTTNEQISYILDSDLLIIDDLGTELSNSFTTSQLYRFIDERILKKRSTIISTNLSFSDLRERYSERLFSRFTGNYDFKQIVGSDIRIQKALKGNK
ncbi:MAG: ATP-binding protein [Butyribacter sp.]|nr:ATP-binding protein [bacterium]MDY3854562.1 ATP-binding protein [Butyribacter sp.]